MTITNFIQAGIISAVLAAGAWMWIEWRRERAARNKVSAFRIAEGETIERDGDMTIRRYIRGGK